MDIPIARLEFLQSLLSLAAGTTVVAYPVLDTKISYMQEEPQYVCSRKLIDVSSHGTLKSLSATYIMEKHRSCLSCTYRNSLDVPVYRGVMAATHTWDFKHIG